MRMHCIDCGKENEVDVYNDKCFPKLMTCAVCGQFCYKDDEPRQPRMIPKVEMMTARTIKIKTMFRLIDDQLAKATRDFYEARGREDLPAVEIYAEVKWSLAELKLNLADELLR